MTVRDFINKEVRPLIGDTLANTTQYPSAPQQPSALNSQDVKYPEYTLLTMLNEGVLHTATESTLYKKIGYAVLRVGDTTITTPSDFKGLYSSEDASAGERLDFDNNMPYIQIVPTHYGIKLKCAVTEQDIHAYQKASAGVVVPSDIINLLINMGQIEAPANNAMIVSLDGTILVKYWYLPIPKEYTIDDIMENREEIYLLRWFVASYAINLDMHNEASNTSQRYWQYYLQRLELANKILHNWNSISLSPY